MCISDRVTFVDVLGLEGCRTAVEECTRRAEEAILPWPDHDFLLTLAHSCLLYTSASVCRSISR